MRQLLVGTLLVASLPAVGAAADDKSKDVSKTDAPAKQLQALFAEYNKANNDLYKPLQGAKTPAEQAEIFAREKTGEKIQKLKAEYARRVLDFADKHPTERPVVADALAWVARTAAGTPEAAKAIDAIIRDHLNDKSQQIDALLSSMVYGATEQGQRLLRAAAEKSKDKGRRIQGRYFLAQYLKNRSESVDRVKALDEKTRKLIEQAQGKEYLDSLAAGDSAKLLNEAENLFEGLAKDAGDAKVYGQSIKDLVVSELFEIRNLAIDKVAPEIEGDDLDGKPLRLSDYRGKVVVLDFWGNW
jgi:hypothetical protein